MSEGGERGGAALLLRDHVPQPPLRQQAGHPRQDTDVAPYF